MKKKIIGIAIMAAIAFTAGWNITQSQSEVSLTDLALINVEALAYGEGGIGGANWSVSYKDLWRWTCYNGGYSYCPL